ncbi:MAG: hypothetical protein ACI9FN_003205 [Saprospiraceae bacterium]|jgi:hypothetical protein
MKSGFNNILLFVFSALLACSSPPTNWKSDQDKLFTKVPYEYSRVSFSNDLKETEENNHLLNDEFITGAGVAIGDVNNDGLLDLYFTGNQVNDRLYLNKGGLQFEDITKSAGITEDDLWSTGVTMADINNDGFLDIYVCKNVLLNHEASKNKLYINNGDLTFTEKADAFNVADKGFSIQSTFFDYDKDGYLDFYLVNQPPSIGNRDGGKITSKHLNRVTTDKLYKKFANGKYHDAGPYAETQNFAYGLAGTAGDLNNDGWTDIYVANDFDQPDHLYYNNKDGKFKNSINSAVKHISNFSMGVDIADYDNDGLLDIIVLDMVAESHDRIKTYMGGMDPSFFWETVNKGRHYQYMFNTLQRNNGNGTFAELAHLAGVSNTDWSWSPLLADLDNDGFKDLFVTNGVKRNMRHGDLMKQQSAILDSIEIISTRENKPLKDYIDLMHFVEMAPIDTLPNYVFKNNGDLTFSKKVEEWGFEESTLSNGAAYGDLDNDGDLDLVINNIDDEAGIYRNNTIEKGLGNYLRVMLKASNFAHIPGTKVRIYKDENFWQLVEVTGSRGYMSQSEYTAHFGLGEIDKIERIEIQWPDGTFSSLTDVTANQTLIVNKSNNVGSKPVNSAPVKRIFKDVTSRIGINFVHEENDFDDYKREILLPHKMSEFGPTIAVGDVNGDGLDDLFVGGSSGMLSNIFIQKKEGGFSKKTISAFNEDIKSEDMGAVFFDADGDKDLDLYVVSGGNEFDEEDNALQDRLYLNDGRGNLSKSKRLPKFLSSGGDVLPCDFDKDGDLDLFIAGRMVPGKYPMPASSYILKNESGTFVDVTQKIAPALQNLGMVTEGVWGDMDGDGWQDLVLVGEWMPITLFLNKQGTLTRDSLPSLAQTNGWYYGIEAEDMDADGDLDLVVGNLGLNYKYRASEEDPFEVYSYDFDDNGSLDIVLSYYEHGNKYPIRGRSCSSQQVPSISKDFPTFEGFGDADLNDIYGDQLESALKLQAFTFSSAYLENIGNGDFEITPLHNLAQTSSINNIILDDFDGDGHKDILISGNLYQSEIETPRNDAGMGTFLQGDGTNIFKPQTIAESGFFAPHDAKSMELISLSGKKHVLVGNNKNLLQVIEVDALR